MSIAILIALIGESHAQTSRYVDSLEKVVAATKSDTIKAKALNKLGVELMNDNPVQAMTYLEKALELSENSSFRPGVIAATNFIGHIQYLSGNYSEATNSWLRTLELRKLNNDQQNIAASYIWLGNVSLAQSNNVKALEYQFLAQAILEELDNKAWMGFTYNNIGAIYRAEGEFSKAKEYFFKALQIDEELADSLGIMIDLDNLGIAAKDEGKYEEALKYYFRALKMKEEVNDRRGMGVTVGNIGTCYAHFAEDPVFNQEQRDSLFSIALQYFLNALELREEVGAPKMIALTLGNIGTLFTETGRYEQAEQYLLEALSLSDSIGVMSHVEYCHEQLSDLYAKTNRYKRAYEHYMAYSVVKDSLFNEDKSKDIGKLEAKYEFETAETERKRIKEERAKVEAEVKTRRDNLQYSGILIFIVILGAGVLAVGKLNIPIRLAEGIIFFAFLLFFEFTLVLLDPYIEQYSSGAPAIKLAFNAVLAALIFPLHAFF